MFQIGKTYHRRNDIHSVLGGQQQGGISTPKAAPVVLLFTGNSGEKHGYKDEFKDDGTFWYGGEGQVGEQLFKGGNRSLRDHKQDGKTLHLFEETRNGRHSYVGEFEYIGHHFALGPDRNRETRKAIVFELGVVTENAEIGEAVESSDQRQLPPRRLDRKSLAELRRLAIRSVSASSPKAARVQNVHLRSEAVKAYVLKRAGGVCEGCRQPAPFCTKKGEPYLEPHHTTRLADGGPDHPAHVIGLCPTCHRRVHHGSDGDGYNETLKVRLASIEPAL